MICQNPYLVPVPAIPGPILTNTTSAFKTSFAVIKAVYMFMHSYSPPNVGDEVLLNTTAVELSLGTGGYHFVIANLNNVESNFTN